MSGCLVLALHLVGEQRGLLVAFEGPDGSGKTTQAARLAAVLPNPKDYNAGKPGPFVRKRAASIASGAETIAADGRSACFDG